MGRELDHVRSHRILRLAQKIRKQKYRRAYVASHVRQFLARQIRELRGDQSQAEFGRQIDKAQNLVSRLEDASRSSPTIATLLEIATKLDRALIVRFVDFQTFLEFTDDQSDKAAAPRQYDHEQVDEFAWEVAERDAKKGAAENMPINFDCFQSPVQEGSAMSGLWYRALEHKMVRYKTGIAIKASSPKKGYISFPDTRKKEPSRPSVGTANSTTQPFPDNLAKELLGEGVQ